jgi:hypothetical protein
VTVEEPGVLGCYIVWMGGFVPEVSKKRIAVIFYVKKLLITLKM